MEDGLRFEEYIFLCLRFCRDNYDLCYLTTKLKVKHISRKKKLRTEYSNAVFLHDNYFSIVRCKPAFSKGFV